MSIIRDEKMNKVYRAIWQLSRDGAEPTAANIARAVGMRKTPYLMGMLSEMLAMGWIAREQSVVTTDAGQRLGYVYSVVTREDV